MAGRSRIVRLCLTLPLVAIALGACGGSAFTANSDGTTGGDSGSAGDSALAGSMNSAGASGSAGSMSSAGAGGKPAGGCECPAGSYCPDGTTKCRVCADDVARIQFAAPVKLATVSQTQNGNERFPRTGSSGVDLFYRSGKNDSEQIWYDATLVSGAGKSISGATLSGTPTPADSGPFLVPGETTQNFFFDRTDPTTNSRLLMVTTWPTDSLKTATAAPGALNAMGDNFSIAIAPKAERAYWMSTRSGAPQLLWTTLVDGVPGDPAVLDLRIQVGGGKTCLLNADDATPWVNATGTVLLFRSVSVDDSCVPNDSGAYDLFAAQLSKETGLAASNGIPLSSVNVIGGGSNETDPSLSADACFLYFASDGGSTDFDIYRAARN